MATKKQTGEPKVIRGSHSIRTEYPDGRVEFETIWEDLVNDVNAALAEYEKSKTTKEPVAEKKPARKTSAKKAVK